MIYDSEIEHKIKSKLIYLKKIKFACIKFSRLFTYRYYYRFFVATINI